MSAFDKQNTKRTDLFFGNVEFLKTVSWENAKDEKRMVGSLRGYMWLFIRKGSSKGMTSRFAEVENCHLNFNNK